MAQQKDLPEGTDTIIPGAMDTRTSDVTGTASQRGGTSPRSSSRRSGSTGGQGSQSGSQSGGIMDKVRSGGDKISEQAADKARDFVGQGIERSSEAISSVSRLIGESASGIDERLGREYGDYARRTAESLQGTADRLARKDPDELIDDTREFIRKSPGVALAGAAIVGFALARLVKSGLSSGRENDRDDDRTGSTRR